MDLLYFDLAGERGARGLRARLRRLSGPARRAARDLPARRDPRRAPADRRRRQPASGARQVDDPHDRRDAPRPDEGGGHPRELRPRSADRRSRPWSRTAVAIRRSTRRSTSSSTSRGSPRVSRSSTTSWPSRTSARRPAGRGAGWPRSRPPTWPASSTLSRSGTARWRRSSTRPAGATPSIVNADALGLPRFGRRPGRRPGGEGRRLSRRSSGVGRPGSPGMPARAVRRRRRGRVGRRRCAREPAAAARRPHARDRRRQGRRRDGARRVDALWPRPAVGLVVTRYGHGAACAAHRGRRGRRTPCPTKPAAPPPTRIVALSRGLTADDLVLCLISGGGSALLALPAAGLDAGRQAGGQRARCCKRRRHRRDELRAQAPVGDQGRAARRPLARRRAW